MLQSVTPEDRFLLVSWFLDQRTLLEISRVLQVHEATVSRRITRLTGQLRQEMLACMVGSGMSPAAAKDAMGTDPRDIEINLRTVLQGSQTATFQERSRTDSQ